VGWKERELFLKEALEIVAIAPVSHGPGDLFELFLFMSPSRCEFLKTSDLHISN